MMVFEKQGLLTGKGLLVKGLSATWQGLILQENQSTSIQLSVPLSASGKYIKLNPAKSFLKQVLYSDIVSVQTHLNLLLSSQSFFFPFGLHCFKFSNGRIFRLQLFHGLLFDLKGSGQFCLFGPELEKDRSYFIVKQDLVWTGSGTQTCFPLKQELEE